MYINRIEFYQYQHYNFICQIKSNCLLVMIIFATRAVKFNKAHSDYP